MKNLSRTGKFPNELQLSPFSQKRRFADDQVINQYLSQIDQIINASINNDNRALPVGVIEALDEKFILVQNKIDEVIENIELNGEVNYTMIVDRVNELNEFIDRYINNIKNDLFNLYDKESLKNYILTKAKNYFYNMKGDCIVSSADIIEDIYAIYINDTGIEGKITIYNDNRIFVEGYNTKGQLGAPYIGKNSTFYIDEPYEIFVPGLTKENIKKVVFAVDSTFILTNDKNLYVAGNNSKGELGLANYKTKTLPEPVNGFIKIEDDRLVNNIEEIQTSYIDDKTTIISTTNGKLYGTGSNESGVFGQGDNVGCNYFKEINFNVKKVRPQDELKLSNYALSPKGDLIISTEDYNLIACGRNNNGSLGINRDISINKFEVLNLKSNMYFTGKVRNFYFGGTDRSYVVTDDNNLWVCGNNGYGQLGVGDIIPRLIWTKIEVDGILDNVKDVHISGDSSFLTTLDDCLWVCGRNQVGQLGIGSAISVINIWTKVTIPLLLNKIDKIYSRGSTPIIIFIVDKDGYLWRTGESTYGIAGDGTSNNYNIFTRSSFFGPVSGIYIDHLCFNASSAYIITKDSNIYVTGRNNVGQLGLGNTANVLTWTKISIVGINNNVKTLCTSSNDFSFILTLNGDIYGCGDSTYGRLGLGVTTNVLKWTKITTSGIAGNVKEMSILPYDSYLITKDNNLWVCGRNTYGNLGLGNATQTNTWTKVNRNCTNNRTKKIFPCFVSSKIVCRLYIIDIDDNLYACGYNGNYVLGIQHDGDVLIPTLVDCPDLHGNTKSVNFNGTYDSTFFISNDNKLYGCGNNASGRMSLPVYSIYQKFLNVPDIDNVKELYVNSHSSSSFNTHSIDNTVNNVKEVINNNNNSSYLITTDNNVKEVISANDSSFNTRSIDTTDNNVKEVIGANDSSYLITTDNNVKEVIGTNDSSFNTRTIVITKNNVKEVITNNSGTDNNSYLITKDNNLYVCGYNDYGQLGLGNTNSVLTWTKITLTGIIDNVKEVIADITSSYLITNDNNLYVCGHNPYGQLGVGNDDEVRTWTKINIEGIINNVKEVIINNYDTRTSSSSSYLITNDDNLYVCGYNSDGQLGVGSFTYVKTWTKINIEGINNNVKEVIISNIYSSYLITNDNNLYVCGKTHGGQLGLGDVGGVNTWTKINIEGINNNVKEVIANNDNDYKGSSYLITNDNNLYVCGRNNSGQLGLGNNTDKYSWTKINIEGINNNVKEVIISMDIFSSSSYLITNDNNLYVCGYNSDGQLGLGNTTRVLTWTKIDIEDINNNVKEVIISMDIFSSSSYLITNDNNLYVCGYNSDGQLGLGNTTRVLTWTKITTVGIIDNVKEVIIINYYSYLITNDNNLYVCGRNTYGQLGVGNTTDVLMWTKITLTGIIDNVKEVITNIYSSYLITNNNNLHVCGNNYYGQLGIGNTTNKLTWIKANVVTTVDIVEEVISNNGSSYLITNDNNLYVCGRNYYSQLGLDNTTDVLTWTKITTVGIIDNVKEVISNNDSSYLITKDNNLYVCGYNDYGQLGLGNTNSVLTWTKINIEGINNKVKEVIINNGSSYLITNDNNLHVCGRNNYGQLGVGNTAYVKTWTKITLNGIIDNVKEVITNIYSSYLITNNNNLHVCGYNNYGQLGLGNNTTILTWTKITLNGIIDNVKEVISNISSSYLITNNNNLHVCGSNYYGQLGLGNANNVLTWTEITLTGIIDNVKEVISNNDSSYLITNNNNLHVCGNNNYGQLGVGNTDSVLTWTKITTVGIINNVKEIINNYLITNNNNLYVCGYNNYGQLGLGNTTNVLTWTKINIEGINNKVKEVIINNGSSYLITNDNNLHVCGYNNYGQLGVGNTGDVLIWTKITLTGIINNVKEVIINNYSYLITNDDNLYVCGSNTQGQLGVGNNTDVKTWTKVDIVDIVEEIINDIYSSYLITNDNNLYVCGNNYYGQLGVGNNTDVLTWTKITTVGIINNVKEIIINNGSSYLITNDNNLYVCGRNDFGQLGLGNTTNVYKWTKITLTGIINKVKEVINNIYSSYLITNDNNLYVCGYNEYGQLGVGNNNNVYKWTKITLTGIINKVKEVIINNYNTSYLITNDDNLYVCGRNDFGQLGLGNTTNKSTWTKIDIEGINNNVKEVININYSYLITNDNNLYVCGYNYYGQLGVGSFTNILTWTKITTVGIINKVKEVINNIYSSYLITNDNNLYVCGRNDYGQLGLGNTTNVLTWTKITTVGIINKVKEVIISNIHSSYLITNDNNLYVCGYNNYGQLGLGNTTNKSTWTKINIEGINNNVKEIIINNGSSYLITKDNNLYVCGNNGNGQLGVGNTTNKSTWTKITLTSIINNVKEVIINNYSYLITNDNNLYVCGYNNYGQLGLGNTTNKSTWTKADVVTIVDIIEEVINSDYSSYLITNDNNLYLCGNNNYGQLGLGNTTNVNTWTKITLTGIINNVKEIIINNGSSYLITKDNNLYVCGYNNYGQLGLGNTTNKSTWTKITTVGIINNVKEVIAIDGSSYLIINDNNLYVCGNNINGQLGVGNTGDILTWTKITLTGIINKVKEIIINNNSSYLITNDNNLYVCGRNDFGQLGLGDTTNKSTWTKITTVGIINNVKEIINNIYSSYLITNDNNLYVCGYNYFGQLGLGNANNVNTWTKITTVGIINKVKEVIINNYSSYLITNDNNLYVCGYNYFGQLGLGNANNVNTWTKITTVGIINKVKEVIINNYSSYLITNDNNLYVCGYNDYGQLGLGNTTDVKTWTKITTVGVINKVKEVIIINYSSYLITNDNNLYVCGSNNYGQLGIGNTTNKLSWTKIDIVGINNNVKEVINNNIYSYLITNDDNLYVCGRNNYGQLGVGNNSDVKTWTKVDIVDIVEEIINDIYSSYLITLDNNLYVCGRNDFGQLGLGNTTNKSTWTKITTVGIINNVKEVIINNGSSYLITNDNNLYVCGYNGNGQLGIGKTTNVLTWTKITLTGIMNKVKEVISNRYSSYLITNDNNLYVCGRNNYGQLGVGNNSDVKTWTKITLTGIMNKVKEVIINNYNTSYLITNDNNLYVCGRNDFGQLGLGNTTNKSTWTKITLDGIIDNVKEVINNYLITKDNNLYVCGYNYYGQLGVGNTTNILTWTKITTVGIIKNVKEVIINDIYSSYLITLDNNLYVCGRNDYGQLGLGNTTDVKTWTKITLTGIINKVKEVIIINYSSYLITNDNNLYVCGRNNYGQLGVGNTTNVLIWTKITTVGIINKVKEVIIINYSSYLITNDNNLYVCGNNGNGQLGIGNITNKSTWTKITLTGIVVDNKWSYMKDILMRTDQLSGNTYKSIYYKNDTIDHHFMNLSLDELNMYPINVEIEGLNNVKLNDLVMYPTNVEIEGLNNVKKVIINNNSSYLITKDNNLYVCGNNGNGQLGVGNTTNKPTWTKADVVTIVDIIEEVINSDYSSYLITNDNNLYLCGSNNSGQLGVEDTIDRMKYELIESIKDNDNDFPIDINNNEKHYILNNNLFNTSLLFIKNKIYYTGSDLLSENNNNFWKNLTIPEDESKNNIFITNKETKSIYIFKDHGLYASGDNTCGKLGVGSNLDQVTGLSYLPIKNFNPKKVYKAKNLLFVVSENGTLYAAGDNTYGQLGLDSSSVRINSFTHSDIFNNTDNIIKDIYINENDNYNTIFIITETNKIYMAGRINSTQNIIKWTSKEKIIEDTFEIVDPNNKETKEINIIINESKTPILSFDSYDDSGVNQKNDFAFEIIIKSKNRYIKSLITCSNNDLNIYTDYSVGKDEIKLSFYKDENNKNILSISSVDIPSNYTINIIPIILKNIILSDDISGTPTTLIKEFVISSDIFGHIDPVDTNRVKIEYANLKKMKMINLSVDVDKLNTYIISNKEISEDILNTNIKSHIKEDDYYGPQFLYTLFSKYIPTNTFVKFIGSIRVNGKMYKTSYVKISDPIVDDKYGVIQFIFDKTQKFINNENKKSAYNDTGENTDISKGLNFGITFYPLSKDGGNRYYVNSSNTFDFEDSLLNQKVSLNCIELNAISPGGKKVAIGNKNSCSITQNSVKLIDNISKRVIKTRSFNYYDNIIFDNCVSLSTDRFALGKDTNLYIVDSNDLFTINKITLTKNISKLFVNNDILIIKYTDNSVDIRQYKNNILLPVTTSNNTSDYIIKSTLNLSTLEFYDYNDFSEVNTSFAHYIDANTFVPYITNESFTDIVPNVSADSIIYLMEYKNKKLNTIHTSNHIKKIYKTIDNSIGAIMDINNNLFLYNANQKKYTQIESELILSDENIKEIFISTYKSQYDYLGLYLIDKDNNIWVCGYNNNDRLGIDGDSFVLTKIDDIGINNNVRSYEFTNSSMIIVTNDNNLWVCGSTSNNATGSDVTTLTKINNENIINNVDHIEILNKSQPYAYRIVVKTIDNKVLLSGTNYYMEFGKPSDRYGFTLIDGLYNTVTKFIEDPVVDIAMCNDILYMTTANNRLFQFSNENDKWIEILLNVNVSKMFIYELNSYVFILTTDNKLYSVFSKAYSIYEAGNVVLEEYDITEIINNNETIKDITKNPDMYIKTENNIIYEFDHALNKFILASDQINLVDIIPGILTYAVDEENNVYIRID